MKKLNKGIIISMCGIFMFSYQNISNHKQITIEKNKIVSTLEKQVGYNYKNNDTYDGIIEIPQINLIKGFYSKDDKRNNINENITVHESSTYPSNDISNLILMAHSGIGEKAYFNDLIKLNTDSLIKIYYHNIKYTYKIAFYYDIEKDGTALIKRDKSKKTLTLITCSQKDKSKQLIYIGYLIDET